MIRNRSALMLVTGVAVGALSAGSVAVAATSTGKQVTMCALKTTGAVRLATKCHKTEKAVKLGQIGPRGLIGLTGSPGATGATGSTGATGPAGPSDAYSYAWSTGDTSIPPPMDFSQSGTLLTLPAGSYAVQWHIEIQDFAQSTTPYAYCTPSYAVAGAAALTGPLFFVGLYSSSGYSLGSGGASRVVTLPATTSVSVMCGVIGTPTGRAAVVLQNFQVVAVKVGTAHIG
ncbi:MAG: hypothetical protein QOI76_2847 [Frankiales bacterium]|nr:hypothetical protein [Frankiales bacterium]